MLGERAQPAGGENTSPGRENVCPCRFRPVAELTPVTLPHPLHPSCTPEPRLCRFWPSSPGTTDRVARVHTPPAQGRLEDAQTWVSGERGHVDALMHSRRVGEGNPSGLVSRWKLMSKCCVSPGGERWNPEETMVPSGASLGFRGEGRLGRDSTEGRFEANPMPHPSL